MFERHRLSLLSFVLIVGLSCCGGLLLPLVRSRRWSSSSYRRNEKGNLERKCRRTRIRCNALEEDLFRTSIRRNENSSIQFISPLLEYGYPVTVEEYENHTLCEKPLLLYLPGFDGTFLCPFLQFPELGTILDVRCMTISTTDRSSFQQLTEMVLTYIQQETMTTRRPIYLMGESFGGLLACNVALQIANYSQLPELFKGLVLINPATSYDRSRLAREGPPVATLSWWNFPAGLLQLLPLFTDEHSIQQLLLILTAQALPSVTDNPMREAYMGRVAFSLPFVIPTLTPSTLDWRLHAWLQTGCQYMATRLHTLPDVHPKLRTLIVIGERDETLPSSEEALRLQEILPNPRVRIVPEAGHASTCGSRADLAAYMRSHFPELNQGGGRTEMKEDAAQGEGAWYGMQERYDSARIGLNPLLYWSSPLYYRKYRP